MRALLIVIVAIVVAVLIGRWGERQANRPCADMGTAMGTGMLCLAGWVLDIIAASLALIFWTG